MTKFSLALLGMLVATAGAPAQAVPVGKDAAVCVAGKPSVRVRVSGFKRPTGTVKVALYEANGYLVKRGKLRAVKVPVQGTGPVDICIAVPRPGRYAIAVHHDLNGNDDKDIKDGAGYSRNPRLSITNLKPSFSRTAIAVGSSPEVVPVTLQYASGLAIRPVKR